MTPVMLCIMIALVMYAMIPSANIANWVSARPLNSCRNARIPPCWACCLMVLTAF